jgi:hypothetical protein
MIEGELREKYIANMKNYYLGQFKYIDNYWINDIKKTKYKISSYKSVEEYEPKQPEPPIELHEVPEWYPELLKLYLTEVSSEYIDDHYEWDIDLNHKDKKTIEEIHNEVILKNNFNTNREYNTYKIGVGKKYENLKKIQYKKTNTYLKPEEYEEIRREVAITESTLIMLATQGCTYSSEYCPVRDKVIEIESHDLHDYGIINEFLYLNKRFNNSNMDLASYLCAED